MFSDFLWSLSQKEVRYCDMSIITAILGYITKKNTFNKIKTFKYSKILHENTKLHKKH